MNKELRFAILGCGFWSNYQLPAWLELEGVRPVALYNRTLHKARSLGEKYGITHYYDNVEELLRQEQLDFVDIVTDVDTHAPLVEMAARKGIPVICQKPMASSLETACHMVDTCARLDVPLYIHENFRWQTPVRRVKELLDTGVIGRPFKANIKFCSSFPVFDNQPFLAGLDQFILTDVGSHTLDISRFLFGEVSSLYCQAASITPGIAGEDVANVFMKMDNGLHCYVEMSYASKLENEAFPQTFITIEGDKGSLELKKNYELRVVTDKGVTRTSAEPPSYPWVDPAYAVVHSSIVDCNRNILQALRGTGSCETTAEDNLRTVHLVWAAYSSIAQNTVIDMQQFSGSSSQKNKQWTSR